MAATAQDASAPLRGPEKKDEDRDEEGGPTLRSEILREHRARSARLTPAAYPIARIGCNAFGSPPPTSAQDTV